MPIPQPTNFLLGTPLYAKTSYEGKEVWDVLDILYYDGTYDSYCTECRRDSTFQVSAARRPEQFVRNLVREYALKKQGHDIEPPVLDIGIYTIQAFCTRVNSHRQYFVCFVDHQAGTDTTQKVCWTFQKIGQQPSYGDLHIAQVRKYTHVLSASQLGELTRAIGLASHDVGVGAYVYLRRIFESLVEEAHQESVADAGWNEEEYQRLRMGERISLLKSHLPTFLVEHPNMYSLLSKGVHELSEAECLKHFETLRLGIELILDERLEHRERSIKIAAAKVAIAKAVSAAGK